MPHKDPEARKAWSKAYRNSDANKARRKRWKESRRVKLQDAEWRDQNYDSNIRRLYGITIERYKEILASQANCCAICDKHESALPRRLCVDHCHKTGVVRGLLCLDCNHAIGKLRDDPALLRKAADYLEIQREPHVPATSRVWGKTVRRQSGGDLAKDG